MNYTNVGFITDNLEFFERGLLGKIQNSLPDGSFSFYTKITFIMYK